MTRSLLVTTRRMILNSPQYSRNFRSIVVGSTTRSGVQQQQQHQYCSGSFLRRRLCTTTTTKTRSTTTAKATGTGTGLGSRGGFSFFQWYTQQLDTNPFTTKIISSAVIAATGDLICQLIETTTTMQGDTTGQQYTPTSTEPNTEPTPPIQQQPQHEVTASAIETASSNSTNNSNSSSMDWYRTGRFGIIGAFFVAPATHYWYGYLSTTLLPGVGTVKIIVQRLMVDQLCAGPLFCMTFMGLLWLLEGNKKIENILHDLFEIGPTLIINNWKLWIPAMGLMFSCVPLKFQVVYSNFVGLIWTVYLSYVASTSNSIPPTTTVQAINTHPTVPSSGSTASPSK